MTGVNKAILIGHLGADPEVRRVSSGDPVVNFNVATSESWKDKNTGERKERTEWHRVVIWNEAICGVAEKFMKKGSKVYLEGKIATRKYTGQDGIDRYTTEIVLERFRGELHLLDRAENNRPPLAATNRLTPPRPGTDEHKAWSAVHRAPPGPDRWRFRSSTFDGIADAMADQWGGHAECGRAA